MRTQHDDDHMSERELLQSQLRVLRGIALLLLVLLGVAFATYLKISDLLDAVT